MPMPTAQENAAVFEVICEQIMGGMSLRKICASEGMPDRATVLRWLSADAELAAKYARARVLQADALEEEMAEIEDRTASGELDPAAARAVLGSKQWRASKLAPKRYGDRMDVNHSGSIDLAGRLAAARLRVEEPQPRMTASEVVAAGLMGSSEWSDDGTA